MCEPAKEYETRDVVMATEEGPDVRDMLAEMAADDWVLFACVPGSYEPRLRKYIFQRPVKPKVEEVEWKEPPPRGQRRIILGDD